MLSLLSPFMNAFPPAFVRVFFCVLAVLLWSAGNAQAQTYTISGSNGTTVTTTAGAFYDSGSAAGAYSNNESYAVTFYSGSTAKMRLTFTSFATEQDYDFLTIYDGSSAKTTQLGQWHGATSPGTVTGSGSYLTVIFTSDVDITAAGWAATISTVAAATTDFGDYQGFASASQLASANVYIGTNATDTEAANPTSGDAGTDNKTGTNDEDLTMPSFMVGTATNLVFRVNIAGAVTAARVNVWVDWNGDGVVTGTNETQTVQSITASGNRSFALTPPTGTTAGTKYLRIRVVSGSSAPAFSGASAVDGEVEDYPITVSTGAVNPNCYSVLLANYGGYINKYDQNGAYTTVIGTGFLTNPSELAAGPDGMVYVSNESIARIDRINPYTNAFIANFIPAASNGLSLPAAMRVRPDGFLYISEYTGDKIMKFNAGSGAFNSSFTAGGVVGITNDVNDKLIVFSEDANRIYRYSTTGTQEAAITTLPAWTDVQSLVVDAAGNYYYCDEAARMVIKVTPAGVRSTFITMAAGSTPYSLAIAPDGSFWIGDVGHYEVEVYSSTGAFMRQFNTNINNPCGIVVMPCAASDFGDLKLPYPTLISHNGPRHIAGASPLKMGTNIDADGDGLPSVSANGDDTDSDGDDEDGVTIPTLTSGSNATLTINSSAAAKVNAFIDWNNDGDFLDASEAIAELTVAAGNNNLSVAVPAGAVTGTSLGARFRLSTAGGLTSVGGAVDGEVEDYMVTVNAAAGATSDYGDYSTFAIATQTANSAIRIGTALTDVEASSPANATATGDDAVGTDDEDLLLPVFTVGTTTSLAVPVTITAASLSGSTARVNAFVDWNGDGDVADTNETYVALTVSASGTFNFNITPPVGTAVGTKYLRVRVAEGATHPGFSGLSTLKGEVEDYAVQVVSTDPCNCPGNLLTNPSFETSDFTGWTLTTNDAGQTSFAGSNLWAVCGTRYAYFNPTAGSAGSYVSYHQSVAASAGQTFTFVAFAGVHDNSKDHQLRLEFYNSSNALLSGGQTVQVDHVSTHTTLQRFTLIGTAPAGTATARVTGYVSGVWSGLSIALKLDALCLSATGGTTLDYGDFGTFAAASQMVSADLRMGTNATDAEAANPSTTTATADDTTGTDDEDLVLPNFYLGDTSTSISIPVTGTFSGFADNVAYLNAYIDWNGDGDVLDTGENGWGDGLWTSSNSIFNGIAAPVGTVAGTKYARIRLSEGNAIPAFSGASALRGEVEDYAVTLVAVGTLSIGNFVWLDTNENGIKDGAEAGIHGVTMELLRDFNNDGVISGVELFAVRSTMTSSGTYSFTGLTAGKYAVRVADVNFAIGQPLANYRVSSQPFVTTDNSVDNDNNGRQPISSFAATSPVITLTAAGETTAEDSNNNTDMTVDFGFKAVSSSCRILYICGDAKAQDGDAYDHGLMKYIETRYGPGVLYPVFCKNSGSSLGLYDVNNKSSELNLTLTNYQSIIVSGTCYYLTMPALETALRDTSVPVLIMTGSTAKGAKLISAETLHWGEWAYDTADRQLYLLNTTNPNSIYDPLFESGTPYSGYTGYVWGNAASKAANNNAIFFTYNAGGLTTQGAAATHGRRAYLGYHQNSVQENPANSRLPVPESEWLDLTTDITATAKAYLDQALDFAGPVCTDFGDYSSFASASQVVSSAIRIGNAATDIESASPVNATATGDDAAGGTPDDEDLTMPGFVVGTATNLSVPVTLNTASLSGSTARVNVFVDWNNDGLVTGTNETLAVQTVSTNGSSALTFFLTPPAGTTAGTKYLRIRVAEGATHPGFSGTSALKGEVEDYAITVTSSADCFRIVISNWNNNILTSYNGQDGAFLNTFSNSAQIVKPSELMVHPDGSLIVAMEQPDNNIKKFNGTTGVYQSIFIASGAQGMNWAYLNKRGPDGLLYVTSRNSNEILRFNAVTGANVVPDPFLAITSPSGLGWDRSGNLYIATDSGNTLRRYDSSGVLQGTVQTYASKTLGAQLGPDGNLYVLVGNTVQKVTLPAGTSSTFISAVSSITSPTLAPALTWGPDNNLYVINFTDSRVSVYTASGVLVRHITSNINGPCGIAFMTCAVTDFGDLPFPYPTMLESNGARHFIAGPMLGSVVDFDGDGQPSATGNGDDTDTDGDDEDGVTIPALVPGTTATLVVRAAAAGKLNAFFDWNADKDFADAGETIAENALATGNTNLSIAVPSTAPVGTPIGARFRLSTVGGLGASGGALDGEVEDYVVTPVCAPMTLDPASLPNPSPGSSYSQTLSASGGSTPYTYTAYTGPLSGTVSQWTANNISTDSVGSNNATLQNGATYTTGKMGQAFSFDGVNDYASVPDNATLKPTRLSVEAWVFRSAAAVDYSTVLMKTTSNSWNDGYGLGYQTGGTFTFWVQNYSTNRATGTLPLNAWTHVVGTYDGVNVRLYFNGAQVSSGTAPASLTHSSQPFQIGLGQGGSYYWNGRVDDVSIYNRALSAAEVLSRYTEVQNNYLPAGLALNSSTGVISGTPTGSVGQTTSFSITATAANGCAVSASYSMTLTSSTDYGDWNGSGAATTTTSSVRNSNLRLGATVDAEVSVAPDTAATADGADEDGVTMPTNITPGASVTIPVRVFNNNTAGRQLQAWIDFNDDGTFNNTDVTSGGERIYNAATSASASLQTINITFTVPAGAAGGQWAAARFRISDNAGTTPTSSGATGEIEDYMVSIDPPMLIEWDMNTGHYDVPIAPSYLSPCVTGGSLRAFATSPLPFISDDPPGVNGPSKGGVGLNEAAPGEGFATLRCGQGFPAAFDSTMQVRPRTDLTAKVSKTWCQFTTTANISSGSITGFVMDIARQGPESPTHMQGYLTWQDGATYKTAWTAAYALETAFYTPAVITNNHPAWRKINLGAFNAGGDALPTNAALAGKNFLFELHIYGDSGANTDILEFDNFALTGTCSQVVSDYGDYSGFDAQASQVASTALRIGTDATDNEAATLANATATGDDTSGTDDEDLTMPIFTVGTSTTLAVPMTITAASLSGSTACVNVFVDWNGDNDVADANETLAVQTVSATGTFNFSLTPPVGTTAGTKYLRIRAAEGATHPGFSGTSTLKGEVEDYAITVTAITTDFGDWNGSGAATATASSTMNSNLRLGALVDAEASVTANATATTDDTTGSDDEDGVTMPASISQGQSVTIPVLIQNNTGAVAYLHSWIDFNNDGAFNDTVVSSGGERLEPVRTINNGTTTSTAQNITFSVPAAASAGTQRGVRFRLTNSNTTTPTNTGAMGEIEDYIVTISAGSLSLGNLLFYDNNNNAIYDTGDSGVPGAVVQLYNSSNALVASTTSLNTTTTAPTLVLEQAHSSVWIENLTSALACLSGTNRSAYWTGSTSRINYYVPGDTDGRFTTGNMDFPTGSGMGYVIRATGNITIPTAGAYTFGMTLDDVGRLRIDGANVILDDSGLHAVADRFGTVTLTAGTHTIEMVYLGVWGGSVELYAQAGTHGTWNTGFKLVGDTANGGLAVSSSGAVGPDTGKYSFSGLAAGSYYVKVPASEFASGKPLYRKESTVTTTITPTDDNRDDNSATGSGDDGIDVLDPTADGIRSPLIALALGAEPTGAGTETGFYKTDDDAVDNNGNLTVDFGFRPATTGCYHFALRDDNGDSWFESTTPPQSIGFTYDGSRVAYQKLMDVTFNTGTKRFTYDNTFIQRPGKRLDGFYMVLTTGPEPTNNTQAAIMYVDLFNRNSPKVTMYVYDYTLQNNIYGTDINISYTNSKLLASSQTTNSPILITATESGSTLQVHISADMTSVNNHANPAYSTYGLTSAWEGFRFGATAGIWSHYYDLPSAPTYNGSFQLTSWPLNSAAGNFSYLDTHNVEPIITENICEEKVGVGNVVFKDANGDGNYDAGEGVDNVLVYLYKQGQTAGLDMPAGAMLTYGGGKFFFSAFSQGNYFLHIPASEFGTGKPLVGTMSITGTGTSDDHVDEDGTDVINPTVSGVSTAVFALMANTEPTDADTEAGFDKAIDNSDDNNTDLTVDLGFRTATSAGIGNMVFIDVNGNGRYDAGDSGAGGVKVELVNNSTSAVVATTTTNTSATAQSGFSLIQMNTGATVVSSYATANTQLVGANASNSTSVIASQLNYLQTGYAEKGRFPSGNIDFPIAGLSNMVVRATGVITIPTAGTWTFGMNLDDGGRLRINGADVIIDDALHAAQDRFGSVSLAAGTHTIEVTFWGYVADHSLEVFATAGSFSAWTSSFRLIGDTAGGGLAVTNTSAANTTGRYFFPGVPAGTYVVRIPASEFGAGKPLLGYASFINGSPTDDQKDDNSTTGSSDNGIDAAAPGSTGISSAPITLTVGTEPTTAAGETGFMSTEDDAFDANYDLTVDFAMVAVMADYGDYSSFGSASQIANGALRIGISTSAATDSEATNPANTTATGDDTTGTDDEDLTMPTFTAGMTATLTVPVTVPVLANISGSAGRVAVWVDWNGDGLVTGTNETITPQSVNAAGTTNLNFSLTPPLTTTAGTKYLRIRASEGTTVPTFTGASGLKGEVEDYTVTVNVPVYTTDYGDHVSFPSASQEIDAAIRIGTNATDGEVANPTTGTANADDTTGTDDEDITLPAITPGASIPLSFPVTLSGAITNASVGAWVDWNADGDANDIGEVLTLSTSGVTTGTTTITTTLNPPGKSTVTGYLRLRVVEGKTAPEFSGVSVLKGEVEDYVLGGSCPTITLNPATIPAATLNTAYTTTLTASGGTGPYDFAVSLGSLPPDVNLNPATGELSGKPSVAGTYSFTIMAVDSNRCNGTRAYSIVVTAATTEYGDLPDTAVGAATGNYNTLSTDSGPTHTVDGLIRLGLTVDGELNGQPNAFATGDGADEDGISTWPNFQRGNTVILPVSVFHNGAPASVNLRCFIDWNNDGDFLDSSETITAVTVNKSASQQTINLSIPVPSTAALECVGLRLRLSANTTLTATGPGDVGEVEDYFITVLNSGNLMDFGDHVFGSLANSASNVASNVIRIGAAVPDAEAADPSTAVSNADDLTGNDEDYDDFGSTSSGSIFTSGLTVTTCSAMATASLGVWVDWNDDGDVADANEIVTLVNNLGPGTSNPVFVFSPPVGTTPGTKYVRVRVQEGSTLPSFSGTSTLKGEVEDGFITVTAPTQDYGDCEALASAWATVNAGLRLGATTPDAEGSGTTNATATADDTSGADDEDGVTVLTAYASGMSSQVTVTVTNTSGANAFLSGWIDFNNTPGTVETNEVIINNVTIATGVTNTVQTYNFTVPAGILTTRDVCARFRLSSTSGTGISGTGGNGEVEDYVVKICPAQPCASTTSVKN